MRFINKNQNVNSISLRAVNGAGYLVLRSYQSLELRLERICSGLFRAPNHGPLWLETAITGGHRAGMEHQTMFMPAIDDDSTWSDSTPTICGKPATGTRQSLARLGLS